MGDRIVLDGELSLNIPLDGEAGTVIEVGHDTGIDTIVFNADYTLTFNMTNGETFTTGSIRGEQGETGAKGEQGDDYVLTQADKAEIAGMVDIPIDDVQIYGTSIVSDGVAEIPIIGTEINSTGNSVGLIPIHDGYANGFQIMGTNSKWLSLKSASETGIKNGRTQNGNGYGVIDPTNISSATFYGLAKAAGHDEKNSTLPVGQYTNSAKSTIKKMIGINDEFELIRCITLEEDSQNVIIDTDESSSPFSLQGFMIAIVSIASEETTTEGYLKIALNSTIYNQNIIMDLWAGIRKKGSNYKNIIIIGNVMKGIGHNIMLTQMDGNGYIIDSTGVINKSLYTNIPYNAFSNQQVINSIFIGTDSASLKLGAGSIIALYGVRV